MDFVTRHTGEFAALLTAIFWTFTALAFEKAAKKIGTIPVNLLRLIIGFLFLSLYTLISRGLLFPSDATAENWKWLFLSGLIGFVFGDLFLFKSYTIIGSRFSMLIMTLVPPITALFSFFIINEHLTLIHAFGMGLTFFGIAMAVFGRKNNGDRITLKLAPKGVLYAFGGAVGQSLGLVLSKLGMKDYNPFAATQIRIIAGIIGYVAMVTVLARWRKISMAVRDREGMSYTTLGAFFGPFLGVSFSLIAVKYTETGVASTIMALVPVFIIIPAVLFMKEKVTIPELIGTLVSVGGVALFFM